MTAGIVKVDILIWKKSESVSNNNLIFAHESCSCGICAQLGILQFKKNRYSIFQLSIMGGVRWYNVTFRETVIVAF